MSNQDPLPQLSESDCAPVPVFNCQIILSRDDSGQQIVGRVVNLAGISTRGSTERDVLMTLTRQFRDAVRQWTEDQQPIPWVDPPEQLGEAEQLRYVPIHL